MIRYTEKDKLKVEKFAKQDAASNLFILANIINYGIDSEDVEVFGEEIDGTIISIILNYRNKSVCLYAKEITLKYIQKIETLVKDKKIREMTCGEETRKLLGDKINHLIENEEETTMAIYEANDFEVDIANVEELKSEHIKEVVALQAKVFESTATDEQKETRVEYLKKDVENGKEMLFGMMQDTKLVSVAEYTAENDEHAMIIGVATDENYRQQGYASMLVKKCCDDLWEKNKKAILFYTNPKAASIYLQIGFKPYKPFYMVDFKN